MAKIFLFIIIVFLPLIASEVPAQVNNSPCPTIEVVGPAAVTNPNERVTFVAKVSGKSSAYIYEWSVSEEGTLVSGQGTPAINVVPGQGSITVKVKVNVQDLPADCANSAEGVAGIAPIPPLESVDEWGKLKPNDKRARLDVFFYDLSNNPRQTGVVLYHGVPKNKRTAANSEIKLVATHARFRKFDISRLTFLFSTEPYSDSITTLLYRIRSNIDLPFEDVVIVKGSDVRL